MESSNGNNINKTSAQLKPPAWFKEPAFIGRPLEIQVKYRGDSEKAKTEALDRALSKFKKVLEKDGVLVELKKREYHKTPGRKRYEKRRELLYKQKVKQKKAKATFTRRRSE